VATAELVSDDRDLADKKIPFSDVSVCPAMNRSRHGRVCAAMQKESGMAEEQAGAAEHIWQWQRQWQWQGRTEQHLLLQLLLPSLLP